tara:strand:+ start:143 stop:367 length:225 start_codon:yes stop_codon:yes gene_type:complete
LFQSYRSQYKNTWTNDEAYRKIKREYPGIPKKPTAAGNFNGKLMTKRRRISRNKELSLHEANSRLKSGCKNKNG